MSGDSFELSFTFCDLNREEQQLVRARLLLDLYTFLEDHGLEYHSRTRIGLRAYTESVIVKITPSLTLALSMYDLWMAIKTYLSEFPDVDISRCFWIGYVQGREYRITLARTKLEGFSGGLEVSSWGNGITEITLSGGGFKFIETLGKDNEVLEYKLRDDKSKVPEMTSLEDMIEYAKQSAIWNPGYVKKILQPIEFYGLLGNDSDGKQILSGYLNRFRSNSYV
jgi:hypothetical protein